MRSVRSKKNYKEWFPVSIKIVTPNEPWNPESTEFVCDTYRSISSKSCTHKGEENLVNACLSAK